MNLLQEYPSAGSYHVDLDHCDTGDCVEVDVITPTYKPAEGMHDGHYRSTNRTSDAEEDRIRSVKYTSEVSGRG